jgi:hypothetical protein
MQLIIEPLFGENLVTAMAIRAGDGVSSVCDTPHRL